jgi:hypothetical protein
MQQTKTALQTCIHMYTVYYVQSEINKKYVGTNKMRIVEVRRRIFSMGLSIYTPLAHSVCFTPVVRGRQW